MNDLQFGIEAYFYTIKRNAPDHEIISIRLSESLNKGIWEFIKQNNSFMEFLQNCMDDTFKQIAITEQTIRNINIKIEVWDRDCDIDDMNCKHICVTFYTSEDTCKAYSFDSKISLSDFNIPSKTALMGNMLIKSIRKEEQEYHNNIEKSYLKRIGIFLFSVAVSYYIEEMLFSALMLGLFTTILWIIIEEISRTIKSTRKKNKDTGFTIRIDAEGKDSSIVFNELVKESQRVV